MNVWKIAAIILVSAGLLFFIGYRLGGGDAPKDDGTSFSAKLSSGCGITVRVTPSLLSDRKLDFDVDLTSQGGSLDYDLTALATLADNGGNSYKPISWEGDSGDSDSRHGTLHFGSLPEATESVTLRLGEMGECSRVFDWKLSKASVSTQTMKVRAYFNSSQMDPEYSCYKVFPVERVVPYTTGVGRAALTELLNGLTEEEKTKGFLTSIPEGVKIQSLTIQKGVAKVDFNDALDKVGGSCRVSAIRSQITETLKQFPTVQKVVISVDGRTEDILQP